MDAIRRAGGTVLAAGAATPVLGPELCSDGGFNIGVADWSSASGVHTWTGSALRRATGQGAGGSYCDFVVVPNQEYLVYTAMYNLVGTGNARVFAYGGGGFTGLVGTLTASGYLWVRPTSANLRLYLYTDNTRGADFDDVSVKLFSGYTYGNPPVRNYFDSAGTDILDSVTQVDQPAGLVLDAAGTVGDEKCPNGTFDSGATDWIAPAGWVIGAGVVTATATSASFRQASTPLTPGKTYQVEFDYTHTSGTLYVRVGAGPDTTFNSSGRKSAVLKATTSAGVEFYGGAVTGVIDNISVRELTGNHATQPTTGSKPTLRLGLVNQLTNSANFADGSSWIKTNVTASGSTLTTTAVDESIRQTVTVTPGTVMTIAVSAKRGTMTNAKMSVWNVTGASNILASDSYYSEINASTFSLAVRTFTVPAGCTSIYVYLLRDSSSVGTTFVDGMALYQGTVTAQQILAAGGIPLTTTAPASSALGNYWWQYDPAAPGDFLQTSITTGNEGWVCAGVNSNSYASAKTIFWTGANAPSEVGATLRVLGGGSVQMVTCDGVAQAAVGAGTSAAAGTPQVIEGGWNATTLRAAVNGSEATAPNTRGGSSTQTAKIGDNFSGQWFNGSMSAIVICPTLPPPADRALIRAWVAKQQGQTL